VLRAVIADISGIANITNIADIADIVTDIADIATDIADIAVETGRHVQGVTGVSRDSVVEVRTEGVAALGGIKVITDHRGK
jgi:hypothetical protein